MYATCSKEMHWALTQIIYKKIINDNIHVH